MRQSLFFVSSLICLAACASTRIIPKEDGSYLMVATSHSDGAAYDAALEKANEHCAKMGKQFAMVDTNSKYQGVDKTAKAVVGAVGQIIRPNNTPQYGHPTATDSTADDYKVEMNFRCK